MPSGGKCDFDGDESLQQQGSRNRERSKQMDALREAIANPPARSTTVELFSEEERRQIEAEGRLLDRSTIMTSQGKCSEPGCRNKIWWSALDSGPICFKHTVKKLLQSGIRTDLNRSTYVCRLNKMHLRQILDNRDKLQAHYRQCPRECNVNSCPRLEGIPRAR